MSQPASHADLSELGLDDVEARLRRLEVSLDDLRSLQKSRPSIASLESGDLSRLAAETADLRHRLEALELRLSNADAVTARVHDLERALEQLRHEQLPVLQERMAAVESTPKEISPSAADYAISAARSVFSSSSSEPSRSPPSISVSTSPWLLLDIWGRFRLVFRMFFDRRFHMAWHSRILLILLLATFLTSHWWCMLSVLPFFDSCLKLGVGFAGYVVLSRELARYQDHLARQRLG